MVDMKKALAFIKENAKEVPKTTKQEVLIPKEIVNEIRTQIDANGGAFAVDANKFNELFGWKSKYNKSYMLKKKLNKQYPLEGNKEWHVGSIEKNTLYKFEIRDKPVKEED